MQGRHDRAALDLAHGATLGGSRAPDSFLDGVNRRNRLNDFSGERRACRFRQCDELATRMRKAKSKSYSFSVLIVVLLIWVVNELIMPPLPMPVGAPSIIR